MKRMQLCLLLAVVLCMTTSLSLAQAPVGTVSGVVTDETGAVIPNASVVIKNKATDFDRRLVTGADGTFSAAALPAGQYEIRVEAKGFRTLVREATVETGSTTTANMGLSVGQTTEVVNVEAASAQISYDSHTIDGVITRQKIQELPLNGRSFLNLASLEPGVRVGVGSTSQYNAQFSVSVLGANAGRTAYNVDGGNIRDSIENSGTSMNFSQEVVQEFQLSTVNFDLSTGITAVGSVNIVTRSGGNQFHGSGYFFFRDHNMAAYPGLARNPLALDPFFARRNPGFWIGGPIIKDKLFFFFNYEYQNQTSTIIVQPNFASLAPLTGTYFSPYKGKTLSARFDYKLNGSNQLFARYSHDGNTSIGPQGGAQYPSNWLNNVNFSDLTTFGWTTTVKSNIVNDFRFNYQYWRNRNLFPTADDCPGCLGIGGGQLQFNSTNITIGNTSNATQGRDLRKFQLTDGINWQKGSHRIRFGGEFEHAPGTGFWGFCDPFCAVVYTPEATRAALVPALGLPTFNALFPNLPTTIRTDADIRNLPFVGASFGVGDPSQPPPYNIDKAKTNDRVRFYYQDSWRIKPRFTLTYGLAWNYETNLINRDLPRPAFLAPLYGSDLSAPHNNKLNFSPALGFAYNVGKDNKTVIRGGAGIYYDSEELYRRLTERSSLGPIGNGRQLIPSTNLLNTVPGVLDFGAGGKPVAVGTSLPQSLMNFTYGQFLTLFGQQIPAITAAATKVGNTDLSVRNIDITKAGDSIYPRDYPTLQAIHFNFGMQRELRRDLVLQVDYARRVFNHVSDQFDFNRFNRIINGVRQPVIRQCAAAERNTPGVECSNGSISLWHTGLHTTYNAMLVKLDKRFSKHFQTTVSYALQSQHGINSTSVNGDNWSSTNGPQLPRHVLNISGIVELKYGFSLGLISSTTSKGPTMAIVNGVDLGGATGATPSAALPGLSYNCINMGCGKDEIIKAVNDFNAKYAGQKDVRGATISALALPTNFEFGRVFQSQDIRLTWGHTLKEHYKFSIFAEMFNVLNYQNLGGTSSTLDRLNPVSSAQTFAFGQYTSRAGQVFGSGGPRAVQIGGRFQF